MTESNLLLLSHETDDRIPAGVWFKLRTRLNWWQGAEVGMNHALTIETANFLTQDPDSRADDDRAKITIDPAIVYARKLATYIVDWSFPQPVTEKSVREVDIGPELFEVLMEYIRDLDEKNGVRKRRLIDEEKKGSSNGSQNERSAASQPSGDSSKAQMSAPPTNTP